MLRSLQGALGTNKMPIFTFLQITDGKNCRFKVKRAIYGNVLVFTD